MFLDIYFLLPLGYSIPQDQELCLFHLDILNITQNMTGRRLLSLLNISHLPSPFLLYCGHS